MAGEFLDRGRRLYTGSLEELREEIGRMLVYIPSITDKYSDSCGGISKKNIGKGILKSNGLLDGRQPLVIETPLFISETIGVPFGKNYGYDFKIAEKIAEKNLLNKIIRSSDVDFLVNYEMSRFYNCRDDSLRSEVGVIASGLAVHDINKSSLSRFYEKLSSYAVKRK